MSHSLRWRRLVHAVDPDFLASEVRRIARKWWRRTRRVDYQVATLEPEGTPRAEVLVSYILDPYLLPLGAPLPTTHTHFWESLAIGRTFVELGCRVDAISWTNQRFKPRKRYDVVIDVRTNLERLAPLLPKALKVLHADTAHYRVNNAAQEERLAALAARRGVHVRPEKKVLPNLAIETADCAVVLGNRFTQESYAYAGKPIFHVPVSVPFTYAWPQGKDFNAVRRRFLWFGSSGLVHKGLDLVLEAFAGLPDFHLTVCGPMRRERDFERIYFRELYATPNIHTLGWVDVSPASFPALAARHLGLVYPSCSEGGGSSVLTCMHAGLIPIVVPETSVDVAPPGVAARGVVLEEVSVEAIRQAVRELAERPSEELATVAHRAWEFARAEHTREVWCRRYRRFAERLLDGSWRHGDVQGSMP